MATGCVAPSYRKTTGKVTAMLRLFTNLVALRAVSDKLLWIAFALFHQGSGCFTKFGRATVLAAWSLVLGRYAAVRPPPTDGFGQYLNNPSLYPPATVDDGRATLILHGNHNSLVSCKLPSFVVSSLFEQNGGRAAEKSRAQLYSTTM